MKQHPGANADGERRLAVGGPRSACIVRRAAGTGTGFNGNSFVCYAAGDRTTKTYGSHKGQQHCHGYTLLEALNDPVADLLIDLPDD